MNNNEATRKGNAILVFVAMGLGVLIGLMLAQSGGLKRNPSPQSTLQGKMDEVMTLVETNYVDSVDRDSLTDHLMSVMLSELDPHSSYLSAKASLQAEEMMRGNFEGVGLVLHRQGDTCFVGQILPDGPSKGSGILPGDAILTVDGKPVTGLASDSVVARLRGPRGTRVKLGIGRGSELAPKEFIINRGVVEHASLTCSTMLDDTTGYIMLSSFTANSHNEFCNALIQLKSKGMRHLIFDLRGNGGGMLSSAVGIAGELLPKGSLIVYMEGAHSSRKELHSNGGGLFTTGRVTVLIDENSASASEVVSGALQDNDRALIAGRRSFGKGLVQTDFSLSDGSSVLLTTARYYTPSGRCIQRSYNEGTAEYYRSYMQRLFDETYADTAWAGVNDSTPYHTIGGRTVYGGGGITPDTILTYRKDPTFAYYNRLSAAGLINNTAFHYVRCHASELISRYTDADAFCDHFQTPPSLLQELASRGEKAGIERNNRSLQAQRTLLLTLMKAYIGQSLFGDDMFYRVYHTVDEDLQKIKHL